ncbi:phosphohydrolase [Chloroflexi bacterium TSY]|nr:phosphohydrolase [Chloroflexi bacterium TSY]
MIDYFPLIHKYISPTSAVYPIYMTHCHLVANKALTIARKLGLSDESQRFIEEAAMLHDIGIIKVDSPGIYCYGELPYLCHLTEGSAILNREGLSRHARVAECHASTGIMREEILENALPLPPRDLVPETVEEEIISFADFFYSKNIKRLWHEKQLDKIRANVSKYGPAKEAKLEEWIERFL